MPAPPSLRTERLLIRPWRDDDLPAAAAMNADPRVMAFFPSTLTPEETATQIVGGCARLADTGYGFLPVEVVGGPTFAGMVGLLVPRFEAHFTPAVEIAWRLAAAHWGRGYATEAARALLTYGFEELALPEIVSFTTVANLRSRRVMEKLGMRHVAEDDFLHPALPDGHPLKPHVLYRLRRPSSADGTNDG
jgi:RimJ/RimL family protein N-acetyltransferase